MVTMFSTVRSLYYLAREAADVPVLLAQALGKGIALGWDTCNAQDAGTTIWRNALVDAEAERDVWEPHYSSIEMLVVDGYPYKTSPPDDVVSADSAGGESPASDSAILPAADAGHPNRNDRALHSVAAFAVQKWINGEPCHFPTYFASIADDLKELSK